MTTTDRQAAAKKAWETIRARKAGLLPPAAKVAKTEKADEQITRLRGLLSTWVTPEPEPEVAPVPVPATTAKKRRAKKAA